MIKLSDLLNETDILKKAIHLTKLPRYFKNNSDDLSVFVPERQDKLFALHPDKWKATFYSLTLKDPSKINFYKPKYLDILPGTLVADMSFANKFFWTKDPVQKQFFATAYKNSLKPIGEANLINYKLPELLLPNFKTK